MTREQIMAGLECLSHHICPDCPNYGEKEKCPDGGVKTVEIARAALELLKEQEPMVDGKSQEVISGFTLYCPNCGYANTRWGTISPWENTVFYCGKCGMEVKWDG